MILKKVNGFSFFMDLIFYFFRIYLQQTQQ